MLQCLAMTSLELRVRLPWEDSVTPLTTVDMFLWTLYFQHRNHSKTFLKRSWKQHLQNNFPKFYSQWPLLQLMIIVSVLVHFLLLISHYHWESCKAEVYFGSWSQVEGTHLVTIFLLAESWDRTSPGKSEHERPRQTGFCRRPTLEVTYESIYWINTLILLWG